MSELLSKSEKLNVLKMLKILRRENCIVKLDKLAEELGVNERSIRRYRELLQFGGYIIESRTGKDGGYQLISEYIELHEWVTIEDTLKHYPDIIRKIKNSYFNYNF